MRFLEAYVFLSCEPLLVWEIAEAAIKIEGVKMAHAVTGQFDVVAYVEFPNMGKLREMLGQFQSMKGVQRTQTAVTIPPRLK